MSILVYCATTADWERLYRAMSRQKVLETEGAFERQEIPA